MNSKVNVAGSTGTPASKSLFHCLASSGSVANIVRSPRRATEALHSPTQQLSLIHISEPTRPY